jgi:ferritin-like metal-binding protein YciE
LKDTVMPEKNLQALFLHNLKDIYFAEQQILKGLPTMAKSAESEELRHAFETHTSETEEQIRRIERIFEIMGQKPEVVPCEGILGIIKEGQAMLQEFADGEAFEAGLIAAAQAIEHYEIARYGTLSAWARQLDLTEVADLIEESLEEEADTDEILSEMAEAAINAEAV